MTSTHDLRLQHIYNLLVLCFHTPPTTSTHHLLLPNTTYNFHTQPITSTHHLRLVHTLPTSIPAYPRLSRPTHVYPGLRTSIPASPAYPEREKTINCLEIGVKSLVTSRCYARSFLSDDSFTDFADFVKIQSYPVINFDDYGLLRASCYGKTRCEYQCKCAFSSGQ